MADGLDVVAVGIANERPEVVLVVLGPQPRLVQHFSPVSDGDVEERLHGGAVGAEKARCDSRKPSPVC